MMDGYVCAELNANLIQFLNKYLEKIFAVGDEHFRNGLGDECEKMGDKYILKVDKDEYNAIASLIFRLSYKNPMEASSIYEMPFVKVNFEEETKTFRLYIPRVYASSFASEIAEIESKLGSNIKLLFPEQLIQYNHSTPIPGLDFQVPNPKTFDQTFEEYELYLERYYEEHGIKKALDGDYRLPYPHEKINYSKTPPSIEDDYKSSYYCYYNYHARKKTLEKAFEKPKIVNESLKPGEEVEVLERELLKDYPKGEKITKQVKKMAANEYDTGFWKKFRYGLSIVAVAAVDIIIFPKTLIDFGRNCGLKVKDWFGKQNDKKNKMPKSEEREEVIEEIKEIIGDEVEESIEEDALDSVDRKESIETPALPVEPPAFEESEDLNSLKEKYVYIMHKEYEKLVKAVNDASGIYEGFYADFSRVFNYTINLSNSPSYAEISNEDRMAILGNECFRACCSIAQILIENLNKYKLDDYERYFETHKAILELLYCLSRQIKSGNNVFVATIQDDEIGQYFIIKNSETNECIGKLQITTNELFRAMAQKKAENTKYTTMPAVPLDEPHQAPINLSNNHSEKLTNISSVEQTRASLEQLREELKRYREAQLEIQVARDDFSDSSVSLESSDKYLENAEQTLLAMINMHQEDEQEELSTPYDETIGGRSL